jgi:hypothetical protein
MAHRGRRVQAIEKDGSGRCCCLDRGMISRV